MESKQDIDLKNLVKTKVLHFFKGCKNKKCINTNCKNSIIKNPELDELRKDEKKGFSFVMIKIKEKNFKMSCAELKNKNVSEKLKKYEILFNFDFNEFLNLENKENLMINIDELFLEIENCDTKTKNLIYSEMDKSMKNTLEELENILKFEFFDFYFLTNLCNFILSYNKIFEIENFDNFPNFQKMLQGFDFKKLFKMEMKQNFKQYSLNPKNYLHLIEYLQNNASITNMMKDQKKNLSEKEVIKLKAIYNTLQFFFSINKLLKKSQKQKTLEFQNDEIINKIESRHEIMQIVFYALKKQNRPEINILKHLMKFEKPLNFRFINYPSIFSVAKKVDFLRYESKILQQMELQKLFRNPLSLLQLGSSGLFLELNLRREHILEDALVQLHKKGKGSNLQKNLKVRFVGEMGVDEGGLTKEFFQLLTFRLFDPDFAMFVVRNNRFLWFNCDSFESSMNFEMVGILLGLALYNSTILEIKFPLVVYKKLKQKLKLDFIEDEIILEDLEEFEPELYTSLKNLSKNDLTGKDSGFFFNISYKSWGEIKTLNLIENGENIKVTEENKHKFIALYLDWYINISIEKQFRPFYKGFFKVLTGEIIHFFSANELLLAICGSTKFDFKELKKTTKYEGYSEDSQTIKDFWKILLEDFEDSQKREFLKFLTGSDRAPLRGLGDIRMKISRHGEDSHLPSAHTCFNHLLLPDYKDFENLKKKLTLSLENCEGFGLM